MSVERDVPFFISNICHYFNLLSHVLYKIGFIPIICMNFSSKIKHFKNNL